MSQLWKKSGSQLHPMVNAYITSPNLEWDQRLLPYDIQASLAHVAMLKKVKLLTAKEAETLTKGLQEICKLNESGKFQLSEKNEDCHSAIENYLTEKYGMIGKKIHTGRSRNDQVLVAMRLYNKAQLSTVQMTITTLAKTILDFANRNEFVPMPGYTHAQQAMLSSVGQWAGAFVESLLDDHEIIISANHFNDQNPLGSAAGFGTSLPIDREFTTQQLGFAKTQVNSLYCQNSRGKIEAHILGALSQVMMTLGKMASDMLLYTTQEFDFFIVDPSMTTGSSIMPQKNNLDIMEVLRANVSIVMSLQMQVQMVTQNLTSGYHKDLKITKQATMQAFDITLQSLEITDLLFQHIKPNAKKLLVAFTPEIFATDLVNDMVLQGIPFREAYQKVGGELNSIVAQDPVANIKSKKHLGATGNLHLNNLKKLLNERKDTTMGHR